jgi:hypothetical protein
MKMQSFGYINGSEYISQTYNRYLIDLAIPVHFVGE